MNRRLNILMCNLKYVNLINDLVINICILAFKVTASGITIELLDYEVNSILSN